MEEDQWQPIKHPVKSCGDAGFATKAEPTLKRRINAAPAKVYAAWTDPEK